MAAKHRVVIIGGGFGGLYAAKRLRHHDDIDITIIDRRNFHLFQPLLYQLATGALSAGDIASPLRSIFAKNKNVRTLLAEATGFDAERRVVLTSEGEVCYDTLIVAPGSITSYFGNDSWRESAVGLKTVEEAIDMRRRIFFAFEAAEKTADPAQRKAWLTFVVVGAGPTGVELAGALGEIANDTLRDDFRAIDPEEASILLVDGNERVLSNYDPKLSAAAERSLIKLGVRFRPDVRVTAVDGQSVTFKRESDNGIETIPTRTIIWAAGVTANPLGRILASHVGVQVNKGGQVPVQPDCSVAGHPEIFVVGDLAYLPQPDGKGLPGVAPVAMQQGAYVAGVIADRLQGKPEIKPFAYWNKGSLAVIGRSKGVADLGRFKFSGYFAWLAWLFIHVLYLVEFENRILVFMQWGFQFFTHNRGSRLITGATQMLDEKKESGAVLAQAGASPCE